MAIYTRVSRGEQTPELQLRELRDYRATASAANPFGQYRFDLERMRRANPGFPANPVVSSVSRPRLSRAPRALDCARSRFSLQETFDKSDSGLIRYLANAGLRDGI